MSQKLLETFTRRWHERLLETPEVVHQLAEHRGVTDIEAVKHLELGLVDVPSPNKLDTNTYRMLKTFGILDPDLIGMVSLPLRTWDNRITNYYFISVNGHASTSSAQVASTGSATGDRIIRSGGVINLKAFNVFKSLVLVDNMADFFAYLQCVKENVIPLIQSERMPGDVADAIRRSKIEEIVLLNDSPYWELLKERLKTTDARVYEITLPEGKSVTEYLKEQSPQRLTAYIEAEKAKAIKRHKDEQPLEESRREYLQVIEETGELRFMGEDRSYRVRGFNRDGFEKIVQLSLEIEGRSFPEKIDLSRSQGRARFANIAAAEFEMSPESVRADLTYIYKTLDRMQDERFKQKAGINKDEVHIVTPSGITKALDLLARRDIIDEILLRDAERLGFVGEEINKKLYYVSAASRLTGEPLSVLVIASSGSGKSFGLSTIMNLMPPEEVLKYSRLSQHALYYKSEEELRGKVLYLEEIVGMEEALKSIRMLLSSGELAVSVVEKDQRTGTLRTVERRIKVVIPVLSSGVRDIFDEETLSRFLVTYNDETVKHRERILKAQAYKYSLEGERSSPYRERILKRHRDIQKVLDRTVRVANAFSEDILLNPQLNIVTRKQMQYLRIMYNVAFLRQHRKERKAGLDKLGTPFTYVEVDGNDVRTANEIASHVFQYARGDLSKTVSEAFLMVKRLIERKVQNSRLNILEVGVSKKELMDEYHWPETTARRFLCELVRHEYLLKIRESRNRHHAYRLAFDGEMKVQGLNLLDPGKLKK